VSEPRFIRNLSIGNTGWFSSPAVFDLDGDGTKEIIAPFYDIAIWDAHGNLKHREERGRLIILASNGALLHDIRLPGHKKGGS